MRLIEELEREGRFLFRWRSFLPLVMVPFALLALKDGSRIETLLGEHADHLWAYACMLLSFIGLAIRWITVGFVSPGTSGRNTQAQRAHALNTTGAYSVVRNPLYLGNFVVILGLALSTKAWWFVLLASFAYWLYIERIIATEEQFLAQKFGATYEEWARRVPAFIPRFSLWCPPAQSFSLRTVLRREYAGVLAVAASYLALELVLDLVIKGRDFMVWQREDRVWIWVFALSLILFTVLRTLKRRTTILIPSSLNQGQAQAGSDLA
jgi:protein-S-isoprenylcysteine O-methyltransferase Ste14